MKTHCFILAALAAAPCFAQDSSDKTDPASLDPLIVTATGHEVPARDVLAATIVIDREEIQRSLATDVAELLRFHAGVELGRNGGPGQVTSVFIRGGESNHTLVLVDGVRVNPATSGGAALQNITPDMVERIEIVKGPRATLYGSDAIAGVINIITRAATEPTAELQVRGGSYDTREGSLFAGWGTGRSGLAVHGGYLETDGFPTLASESRDRGYRQTTFNMRGNTEWQGLALSAQAWNAESTPEYFDFFGTPLDQNQRNQSVSLGATAHPTRAWESRLSVSRMEDEIRQNQSDDFVRTVRPVATWLNAIALGDAHRISLGLEAAREDVDALSFGSPISEVRDLYGSFVQYELSLDSHHALAAVSFVDHDAFGSQVNWNGEYGIDLFSGTRLIAAAGTGFRAPDATDRFGFGGNPDLDPERARNYELGLRQTLPASQGIELRLFRSEVEDLISVECDAFFNCLAVNIDKYRNDGAELSYRVDLGPLSARLSAIKQDPRSVSRPDPCSGEARLCRRAEESATASIVGRLGPGYLGLDVLGTGERLDFGGTRLPGYASLNLTGGVEFRRRWRVAARVENVLDKEYQTAAGYNQPDRSFFVTLGARL